MATHFDTPEETTLVLQRELLAEVRELGVLANVLQKAVERNGPKRGLKSRPNDRKGPPTDAVRRLTLLRDRVARSKASLQETVHSAQTLRSAAEPAPAGDEAPAETALERASLMVAKARWVPGETEIQRGRVALLEEFELQRNLPVADFAHLAGKSKQQIYKDLQARPARLLALSVGARGQRIPEWQLHERGRLLTQSVLRAAPTLDSWTVYKALSQPAGAFGGRSPADVAEKGSAPVEKIVAIVLDLLGVTPGAKA